MSSWDPATLPRGPGRIRLERVDGRLELVLDNPSARNAVSTGMMCDLADIVAQLVAGPDVAVVIRGEAPHGFCSGGDLRAVRSQLMAPGSARGMQHFMTAQFDRLHDAELYVVAAVEGAALGGGAEILTACDEVFAATDAQVGFVHATLGVSCGWGGARRLVHQVGQRRAQQLLLPDDTSAVRAAALGLVDHLTAPGGTLRAARARVDGLLAQPSAAVRAMLRICQGTDERAEQHAFEALWGGPDHQAALAALDKGRA